MGGDSDRDTEPCRKKARLQNDGIPAAALTWRDVPHNVVLYILEFLLFVMDSSYDDRDTVGRFMGDPLRVPHLLFRSVKICANWTYLPSDLAILSQVRYIMLECPPRSEEFYMNAELKCLPDDALTVFAHERITAQTMPNLRTVELDCCYHRSNQYVTAFNWLEKLLTSGSFLMEKIKGRIVLPTSRGTRNPIKRPILIARQASVLRHISKFSSIHTVSGIVCNDQETVDLLANLHSVRNMGIRCDNIAIWKLFLETCTQIDDLSIMIDDNSLIARGSFDYEWFDILERTVHLRSLSVDCAHYYVFTKVPVCPSLEKLHLEINISQIENVKRMPHLKHLMMTYEPRLPNPDFSDFVHLKECQNLRHLALNLSDDDALTDSFDTLVKELANNCKHIRTLTLFCWFLESNDMGAPSVKSWQPLAQMKLERLALHDFDFYWTDELYDALESENFQGQLELFRNDLRFKPIYDQNLEGRKGYWSSRKESIELEQEYRSLCSIFCDCRGTEDQHPRKTGNFFED